IFVDRWPLNFIESMKWLPETRGLVTILRQFSGEIVFRERAHLKSPIAHPLLIYAELLFQGQERALETARMVYDRYLIPLLRE
ncbi:MAG: type IV toxin-antitoxin system AbiEi family antitoxin, partial [Acidobacteriota bacterium]